MYVKAVFFLSLCSTVICDSIVFNHLLGYSLYADANALYNSSNPQECIEACYDYYGCTGIQMLWGTGQCSFLQMFRGYTYNTNDCSFYVIQLSKVSVKGRNLTTPIDQQVQNLVYSTMDYCPFNWTIDHDNYLCKYTTTKQVCNQYEPFFEASWNKTECIIPLMNSYVKCPNHTYVYHQWSTAFSYCYYYTTWTPSGSSDLYTQADDYCYAQTGGHLVSIHSDDENEYVASFLKDTEAMIIGLVSKNGSVSTVDDLKWIDGMPVDYTNFTTGAKPTPTGSFKLTVIQASGLWDTDATSVTSFTGLLCKHDVEGYLVPIS
uniref:C-type lectin domain-containing protein n=1 Tax=Panagrellus redivivus TaxID=6233 RepID=A0A7E4V4K1_PANRE